MLPRDSSFEEREKIFVPQRFNGELWSITILKKSYGLCGLKHFTFANLCIYVTFLLFLSTEIVYGFHSLTLLDVLCLLNIYLLN